MADSKKKNQTLIKRQNVLESLKDLGGGAISQTGDILKNSSEDFFRELFGLQKQVKKTGELSVGENIQIDEVLNGKADEEKKAKKQLNFERSLFNEEKLASKEKTDQLKLELQAIMQEVQKVAESSENLAAAAEVATMTAPVEPGIYHVNFFTQILEFLVSFRKKIDLAATWLASANKRAEKKNYWAMYKKKGSSFLLSPDHYLQRGAG